MPLSDTGELLKFIEEPRLILQRKQSSGRLKSNDLLKDAAATVTLFDSHVMIFGCLGGFDFAGRFSVERVMARPLSADSKPPTIRHAPIRSKARHDCLTAVSRPTLRCWVGCHGAG